MCTPMKRLKNRAQTQAQDIAERLPAPLQAPEMALSTLKDSELLKSLGVTPKYVLNEFMKIVNQDDDLSNKLKAIKPLAKEIGIDIDGTQQGGITNNIIVMPAEITKKFNLASPIIEGDVIDVTEQQTKEK
jgi:hypothetical protein